MILVDLPVSISISIVVLSGFFLVMLYNSPKHDKKITRGFSMHNAAWKVLLVIIFDILSFNLVSTMVAASIVVALSMVGFHESKKPKVDSSEQPEAQT